MEGSSSDRIKRIAKKAVNEMADEVTRRIEALREAQPTCMRPCPSVAPPPPKDTIMATTDAPTEAIEPRKKGIRTTMAVLSQSTTVKVSAGVVVGGLITAGGWAWNGLDDRIKSKADAQALQDAVSQLHSMNVGLTDHEKRLIELKTRREVDDRETTEFRLRYASDQAEVKASLRRIEDFMMREKRQ